MPTAAGPLLLILGLGAAVVAAASSTASAATPPTTSLPGLDANIDPQTGRAILQALQTETDPAKLAGFAKSIEAQFPLAAAALIQRAATLQAAVRSDQAANAAAAGLSPDASTVATPAAAMPPDSTPPTSAPTVVAVPSYVPAPGLPPVTNPVPMHSGDAPTGAGHFVMAGDADVSRDGVATRYSALLRSAVGTVVNETHNGRQWQFRVISHASDPNLTTYAKDVKGWVWRGDPSGAPAPSPSVPVVTPHTMASVPPNTQIAALQAKLNQLHVSTPALAVDGINGPKTIAAVKIFQLAHGLAVDGIAGPQTNAMLDRAMAGNAPVTPLASNVSMTTPLPAAIVSNKDVQTALNALGAAHPPLTVDGVLGPLSKAAVIVFQKAHGLAADGIPGPKTKGALTAALAALHGGPQAVAAGWRHGGGFPGWGQFGRGYGRGGPRGVVHGEPIEVEEYIPSDVVATGQPGGPWPGQGPWPHHHHHHHHPGWPPGMGAPPAPPWAGQPPPYGASPVVTQRPYGPYGYGTGDDPSGAPDPSADPSAGPPGPPPGPDPSAPPMGVDPNAQPANDAAPAASPSDGGNGDDGGGDDGSGPPPTAGPQPSPPFMPGAPPAPPGPPGPPGPFPPGMHPHHRHHHHPHGAPMPPPPPFGAPPPFAPSPVVTQRQDAYAPPPPYFDPNAAPPPYNPPPFAPPLPYGSAPPPYVAPPYYGPGVVPPFAPPPGMGPRRLEHLEHVEHRELEHELAHGYGGPPAPSYGAPMPQPYGGHPYPSPVASTSMPTHYGAPQPAPFSPASAPMPSHYGSPPVTHASSPASTAQPTHYGAPASTAMPARAAPSPGAASPAAARPAAARPAASPGSSASAAPHAHGAHAAAGWGGPRAWPMAMSPQAMAHHEEHRAAEYAQWEAQQAYAQQAEYAPQAPPGPPDPYAPPPYETYGTPPPAPIPMPWAEHLAQQDAQRSPFRTYRERRRRAS